MIPLGRATEIADHMLAALRTMPEVDAAEPVGSLRRGEDLTGEIEIVAITTDPSTVFNRIQQLPGVTGSLDQTASRLSVQVGHVAVGIQCSAADVAGATILHLTGDSKHVAAIASLARRQGLSLRPDGLFVDGRAVASVSEDAIYGALDLAWIPPEIRYGAGEVEAAARALPRLISRTDLRGDLHVHSNYSDGRDSIETMVRACLNLGHEYVAITDHSQGSLASRNLSVDSIARQRDEIAALREKYPQIAILQGCEVDILPDGRLDFDHRVLEPLDLVIASLHGGAGYTRDQLLARYLAAIDHPLVTIITHPTNRMVPHRAGYDLDYDRLFDAAAESGTVIEIDGAPGHLDLDGELARRAIARGAMLSIDSDSHRSEGLEIGMKLGVVMARRGWVEPRHVLNTRSIAGVRDVIAAKRERPS